MNHTIDVATEFYPRPAGRFYEDGAHSGQRFREEFLVGKLKDLGKNDKLIIDFSKVTMAGSSFLEESFGGLIRKRYITKEDLLCKIEIISPRKIIKERIFEYIKDAKPDRL